jgi:hypothetical protein
LNRTVSKKEVQMASVVFFLKKVVQLKFVGPIILVV